MKVVCALLALAFLGISKAQSDGNVDPRPVHTCDHTVSSTQSCYSLSDDIINRINEQVQREFDASHTYLEMSDVFARDEINYRGLAKFFRHAADEERDHGIKFMDYLNKRGGYYSAKQIHKPTLAVSHTASPLAAMEKALLMERNIYEHILDIHWYAQEKYDPHFQDFMETEFLTEQVDSIRQISGYVGILTRLGDDALALHTFDEELYHDKR